MFYTKCIAGFNVLNFTASLAGSLLVLGSILDSIFMPSERAFGGMSDRNSRAGFERRENGLKVTRTSVRNRVIMMAGKTLGEVSDARLLRVNESFSEKVYRLTYVQSDKLTSSSQLIAVQ